MSWTIGVLLACQQYSLTLIRFYYAKQFQNTISDAETQASLFPIFCEGCAQATFLAAFWILISQFKIHVRQP